MHDPAGDAHHREIFEAASTGIWITDREGRVLDVNPAGCELLGRSREQILGRPIDEFTHPHDRAGHPSEPRFAAAGVLVRQRRFSTRDGGFILAEERARVLAGGRIVTVVQDVTDLARAERALAASEREFRGMFELSGTGTATEDAATGRYLRVNHRLCEITGYSEAELLARTFLDITHPEDRERDLASFRLCVEGTASGWTSEKRYVRKDGTIAWVIVTGTLVRDDEGRPVRTVATIHDITDRKEMEQELRDLDRRKDEFLAMLSHELRNPLAAMRHGLGVLARAEPGSEPAGRARSALERQLHHLGRLVDDLLDLTRVSRGKIQLRKEPLDLVELVRRTVEDHRALFAAAGLSLELSADGAAPVLGDAIRLSQIVANLLQNAAKFTPAGGRVGVELRVDRAAGEVEVLVSDSGVGLTPSMLDRLFQPFAQADVTLDRSRGGLGLGLALVRALAEMHGGKASAASEGPGRGAAFAVRLPLFDGASGARSRGAEPTASACARRVLVVDDNVDAAETLRDLLTLAGHDVSIAHDGPGALAKARETMPEVVLCDIGLPGMDGYAVARALRADAGVGHPLLVALTGYALPDDVRRATAAGFDAHLAKPPELEAIASLLRDGPPQAASPAAHAGV